MTESSKILDREVTRQSNPSRARLMRIAIVSRELPPYGGGIGSWSQKASQGLVRIGHEVHLFTQSREGLAAEDIDHGVHLHRVAAAGIRPRSIGWAWAVASALTRYGRFDVVQACEWDAEAITYALRPSAPLVTRLATPHYLVQAANGAPALQRARSMLTSGLERAQARRSRRVISPTRALARAVAQKWGLDEAAITVVPTGIDAPTLAPGQGLPFLGEAPFILYFGRLEVRKGVDVLIDALPEVLAAHPDVHCVFIGEDIGYRGRPFAEYAHERCADVRDRLHFLPRMPHGELFQIVAAATLVAIPSRWENLANTCLESMVLRRAIITTSGSGFDEVLTDGVDGILVPPGDAPALAAAAISALGDSERLERLGAAAARRAEDFTVDGMARRLEEVYASVVA